MGMAFCYRARGYPRTGGLHGARLNLATINAVWMAGSAPQPAAPKWRACVSGIALWMARNRSRTILFSRSENWLLRRHAGDLLGVWHRLCDRSSVPGCAGERQKPFSGDAKL